MARPRALLDTHGQAEAVAARLKGEPAGWRRERLLAVKFGLEGQLGLYEIAERLRRPRSVIQRWFDLFRQGGLERLLHKGRGKGTPSRLTAEAAAALRQKVEAGTWRRAADAQRWLAETHGIVVGLATVYKYLKRLGARLKVPRPCHQKHDPVAAEAFKATLAQKLSDLKLPAREPEAIHVVLWDGASFHPDDGAPELPANVRLIAFPSYSPELNPVEKLWDQLKDRICNQPFGSLQALEAVMTEFLRAF